MRYLSAVLLCLLVLAPRGVRAQELDGPQPVDGLQPRDLKKLSIEELTQIDVTSVSRRPEQVSRAAAAVSVVRGEDIRRSGALILAEAMRLGDAVDVARVSGNTWGISIRGFNISTANKLLVLVDGRTTYSGLFGGTFWDAQDTFLPDLDRLEVIRGPGGSIWGANAVNGVINIISKPAADTQGTSIVLVGGINERAVLSGRYGGRAGSGHYRVYGKYRVRGAQDTPSGASARDEMQFAQGGFRFDSDQTGPVAWSVSGAAYGGTNGLRTRDDDTEISGGHLLGRWIRRSGTSNALTVQAYYDRSYRKVPAQFEGTKDVGEFDVQQQVTRGRHLLVAGGTARVSRGDDLGAGILLFEPQLRTGWAARAFIQDEITIRPEQLYVVAGTQFGRNNFTGGEFQPHVRVRVHPSPRQTAWAAVSRAVRLPTRFDEDLRILDPTTGAVAIRGSEDFEPERVIAYEAGYRTILHPRLSIDTAVFVNNYDRLRSQERMTNPTVTLLENGLNARTRGIEVATTLKPLSGWRVHASYAWLGKSFTLDPGSNDVTAGAAEGNDPSHLFSARSYLDLPRDFALDAMFRYVGRRPAPVAEAYAQLDLRLGWMARPGWELSLVGQNLLHERHAELFSPATPTLFPRAAFLRSIWAF